MHGAGRAGGGCKVGRMLGFGLPREKVSGEGWERWEHHPSGMQPCCLALAKAKLLIAHWGEKSVLAQKVFFSRG